MKFSGILDRTRPMLLKLFGQLPLCPWRSAFIRLHPKTFGAIPPAQDIKCVERDGDMMLLRFEGKRDFWYPATSDIDSFMWSEYLSVFWEHPANFHYYLRPGTAIRDGDVVLDCGTCEGTFTRQALEHGAAKVICLEPNSDMKLCLERTFSKEIAEGKVLISQTACGAYPATARFSSDQRNHSYGKIGDSGAGSEVAVDTISNTLKSLNIAKVDFIKMDIEGAEVQALEGAMQAISDSKPRLSICTYHRAFDFKCLSSILTSLGYKNIKPIGISSFAPPRPIILQAYH